MAKWSPTLGDKMVTWAEFFDYIDVEIYQEVDIENGRHFLWGHRRAYAYVADHFAVGEP